MLVAACLGFAAHTLRALNHPAIVVFVLSIAFATLSALARRARPARVATPDDLRATIFVALVLPPDAASVDLDHLFEQAEFPMRVCVGVYDGGDRVRHGERWRLNVRVARHMDHRRAFALAGARAWTLSTLRRDELYTLLVPCDARVARGWDSALVAMHARHGSGAVVTSRCNSIARPADRTPRFLCLKHIGTGCATLTSRRVCARPHGTVVSLFWSPHFSFCRSAVFDATPLLPSVADEHEAVHNGVRLWTSGATFVVPDEMVAWAARDRPPCAASAKLPALGRARTIYEYEAYTGAELRRGRASARAYAGLSVTMRADECACKYGSLELARLALYRATSAHQFGRPRAGDAPQRASDG